MDRLQQGQTSALDELYRRYAPRLCVFCRNFLRSPVARDPEDVVQDVFVRVIKSAHTFDPGKASFRTWLFRIARNRCLDVARRGKLLRFLPIGTRAELDNRREELASEQVMVDESADVETKVARASATKAVRDCIAALENKDERQALILYYLSGKVYREIGEILGKSTSMARNRVKAAQEKVKHCLERHGIDSVA
jgi:RNA polymerase sigma-70 factor (ECF subfamily)